MHINFGAQQNEASALTRGGRPTKLFDVVELILKNGGSVRKGFEVAVPATPGIVFLAEK